MTPQILVTGSSGLVGSRFVELFPHPHQLLTPSETEFNLLDSRSIKSYLSRYPVTHIINFAAFTDVTAAQSQSGDQSDLCWRLNVTGLTHLLDSIDPGATHFIQISTDMVFSGQPADPGPYPENHPRETTPHRLTWYGYTKSVGEQLVAPVGTIVRICNPVRAHFPAKLDYFRKPLSLFDQHRLYPLFSDQQVSVSYIDDVSAALHRIVSRPRRGIFHVSSSDTSSPHAIISQLLAAARHFHQPLPSSSVTSLQDPVRYPQFAGLSVSATQADLGLQFSSITQIIDQLIAQGLSV